jgi:hypothetical protein
MSVVFDLYSFTLTEWRQVLENKLASLKTSDAGAFHIKEQKEGNNRD